MAKPSVSMTDLIAAVFHTSRTTSPNVPPAVLRMALEWKALACLGVGAVEAAEHLTNALRAVDEVIGSLVPGVWPSGPADGSSIGVAVREAHHGARLLDEHGGLRLPPQALTGVPGPPPAAGQ